ncbi:protein of unknown function [Burkholderia multivorans]
MQIARRPCVCIDVAPQRNMCAGCRINALESRIDARN